MHARFQSPRGDFGFLKVQRSAYAASTSYITTVSIPSRGFWFFEGARRGWGGGKCGLYRFQSPRGDFGFLKHMPARRRKPVHQPAFQSPRGDFGFLKADCTCRYDTHLLRLVSIPSRGFWFFEEVWRAVASLRQSIQVSIPSRGFWFFEGTRPGTGCRQLGDDVSIPSRGFWFFEVNRSPCEPNGIRS